MPLAKGISEDYAKCYKMDELKQLDDVLKFLANPENSKTNFTVDELFKALSRSGVNQENIEAIANKLDKDEFVNVTPQQNNVKRYKISFEGIILICWMPVVIVLVKKAVEFCAAFQLLGTRIPPTR